MHRREFLRGVAGSAVLSSVGAVGAATAHPGPYRPFGSVSVENAKEAVPGPDGEVAYVAATDGFAVVDVAVPNDPRILFETRGLFEDRETGPLRGIQDVTVEGDLLVVAGPADPIPGDVLQGIVLYDVSDPENPEQVGFHETTFPIHNCILRGGMVYLTGNQSERNELVVVDASDGDPTEVGRWSLADRDERWEDVPSGLWSLHDVWVRDDRAYLAHWDAGTYVLDVSDLASPSLVSRVGGRSLDDLLAVASDDSRAEVVRLPGNDHYAMTNDDGTLLALNKEAWATDGEDGSDVEGGPGGVELWDLSDETSPERLATIEAPASPDPTIGGLWTTSHNLDLADGRLYTSWYQGGVKIHDVSDPANPEQLAWWRDPEETSFWTAKLATPEFFVASSMGRQRNEMGALFTFPNHSGEQKSPPTLTESADATDNGTVSTATSTTTERSAFDGETTTAAESDAAGTTPGFGITAGVAALLGAGAWTTLREDGGS